MLYACFTAANVVIDPVDSTNGILLLREGKALKQIDSFSLACVYNITDLRVTTSKLMALFSSIKLAESHASTNELHKTYKDQIDQTLNLIDKKISFITPHARAKRGLINGLGSIVKTITGNLDNDDAIKYETEISNLKNQIHKTQNLQKKSLVLAETAVNEFNNQIHKINENQNNLVKIIQNTSTISNALISHINFLDMYVQIDFSLQLILDKLMVLEDAMSFSQLGVVHPSIIGPHNLVLEILKLEKLFSFKPVVEISVSNIHVIERAINVKAYSTQYSLTFILEIPSIDNNVYDFIHLFSIPNKNNLAIVPISKYLILGSEEYTYMREECRPIREDIHLCKSLEMRSTASTEDCIPLLIQHKNANCTYARINLKAAKIQKIGDNSWIIVSNEGVILKIQCGSRTEYRRIQGVNIIKITSDCQVRLNNITLQSHLNTIYLHEVIPVPNEQSIPQENIRYEVKLEDSSLDNLHHLINEAQSLRNEDDSWPIITATPSWTSIIFYVIVTSILVWRAYKWFQGRKAKTTISSEDATGSCKMRFRLKEGGVTTP
ncbi:uncharacterized protein [Epargyreus clarus]|uniref:uncharacterized protein n=1 Tax=Epargyreus clarus TaxID=520877 RepID=UPI003C2F7B85